ncbi:MAG: gamma-glutamylcyclotransferase [Pseudomonadota bacterium]
MPVEALFFYGTLRDPETLATVLGPYAGEAQIRPAQLPDVAVYRVRNEDYPIALPEEGATATGLLVEGLSEEAKARLAFFEDEFDYALEPRAVHTDDGPRIALVFIAHRDGMDADGLWDFDAWQRTHQPHFLWAARELMERYGTVPMEQCDALWTGLRGRILADWRASQELQTPKLGTGLSRDTVEVTSTARPYQHFFGVEEYVLRHPQFGGGQTNDLARAVFLMADAVTVLPWDPNRDEVLLIEQFRVSPFARGDAQPWLIECVAGRLDGVESPESAVRREAHEEAGLELTALEQVAAYYPSTGAVTEHVTSFIGCADLSQAGGTHGVESEGEDIRAFTLLFAEAEAAVARGEIRAAPLILSLYYLRLHHARLMSAWST